MDSKGERGVVGACCEDVPERVVRESSLTGRRSPGRPHKRCSASHSGNNMLVTYLKENKKKKKMYL
jgi:hypothetical protein